MAAIVTARGRVIAVQDGRAELRLAVASACGRCGAKSMCGSGQERSIQVNAPPGTQAGDLLDLTLPEARLGLGALLGYLLPAFTTLLGTVLLAPGGDAAAILGAGLGLGAGLVLVRRFATRLLGSGPTVCPTSSTHGENP